MKTCEVSGCVIQVNKGPLVETDSSDGGTVTGTEWVRLYDWDVTHNGKILTSGRAESLATAVQLATNWIEKYAG